ncbi:MAG: glycosyltransferase [Planctomycetaceae bacterium]
MKRIAFVIPTLDQSGAERQLTLLATALAARGDTVCVIALNRGGHYQKELERAGIPVHVCGKRFRFDILTWMRLRRILAEFQPQIVQSFLFAANAYVRLPGVLPAGCQCVISERCVDSWKSGWQLSLDRKLWNRSVAVTANSESVANFYHSVVGIPRERLVVIPNAVVPPPTDLCRRDVRAQFGFSDEHKVVGFIGRLAAQKRLRDLVWAFQLLQQIIPEVRLVVIGQGPERDAMASMAVNFGCREKIVFAGHRDDASSLLVGMDAFVLPSEFEGMSNSLMEAMSAGLPCVVSDIDANRELVEHDVNGLVFPLGQCPELTKSLVRLFREPDLAGRLGLAASDLMKRNHSVEQLVTRHCSLYDSL